MRDSKGYYKFVINDKEYDLISVTTVLKRLAKPALLGWYGKWGNKKCREILTEAGDIGSAVHSYIEHVIAFPKSKPKVTAKMRQPVKNYRDFVLHFKKEMILSEQTVYSIKDKYAGQFDELAYVTEKGEKKVVLIDYKTSNNLWPEMQLQVEAYYRAFVSMVTAKVQHIPVELWCVKLDKTRSICYTKDIARYKPSAKAYKAFLGLLDVVDWQVDRQ